jgi:transposase, IS5 family
MLKLREEQVTLWDVIIPESIWKLPEELVKVDQLLDDERFMQPFLEKHSTTRGRPTKAIETFLRLMYLKRRYNLGYETLVQEVGDSLTWRRFCRISIDEKMPDSTTLIKARKRYGDEWVEQLNELLLQKLDETNVLKHRKFRTDTTVVESDIHHPTDATLLQDGVKMMTRLVGKIGKVASHATRQFEDKTTEVKHHIFSIVRFLRRRTRQSWEELNQITEQVATLTEEVCEKAEAVMGKVRDKGKASVKALKQRLGDAITRTKKLVDQARQVVSGNRIIKDRIVSFHDPEARPIKKGKLSKTTEFGYKARIDETENGFVTGYELYKGNPPDEELLVPAVEQHQQRFGSIPNAVATDRGFSSMKNETKLAELGVARISTPSRGKKSKGRAELEKQLWYKHLQRYRAAGEAKISLLKRKYGLSRSRYRGFAGSKTWVGLGIWVYNLRKAAQMVE